MPMARSAVLVGRTTADLVRNVADHRLMIVVGYLIGFRFQAGVARGARVRSPSSPPSASRSAGSSPSSALTVRGAETAQSAGFVVIFPLVFASSVFVPVVDHAGLAADVRQGEPGHADRERRAHLALDGGVPDSLAGAAAWIVGLLAVFVPLCVWRYRRMS